MTDRAEEVETAVLTLRQRVPGLPVGALGFSQAGWVLPRLGSADADFLVLVGPAVSWCQQGDYYDRVNLAHQGLKDPEIDDELARRAAEDDRRFAPTALYHAADMPNGMSQDRWAFIQRNRDVDARGELHKLQVPLLAIWGADDLNVDTAHDAAIYRQIFMAAQNGTQIVVVPKATHGLLKSGAYNWQLTDDWSLVAKLRFLLEERYAYAPKALPTIIDWIDRQARPRPDEPL
ncbi:alpha/beta hydrolase [Halovulum sp. GXIMD14793]